MDAAVQLNDVLDVCLCHQPRLCISVTVPAPEASEGDAWPTIRKEKHYLAYLQKAPEQRDRLVHPANVKLYLVRPAAEAPRGTPALCLLSSHSKAALTKLVKEHLPHHSALQPAAPFVSGPVFIKRSSLRTRFPVSFTDEQVLGFFQATYELSSVFQVCLADHQAYAVRKATPQGTEGAQRGCPGTQLPWPKSDHARLPLKRALVLDMFACTGGDQCNRHHVPVRSLLGHTSSRHAAHKTAPRVTTQYASNTCNSTRGSRQARTGQRSQ